MSEDFPKGPRPGDRHTTFTDDPVKEHLLRGLVTLSMELSVTRDRVATLEALLAEAGVIKEGQADAYEPGSQEAPKRAQERQKLIEDILGPLLETLSKTE